MASHWYSSIHLLLPTSYNHYINIAQATAASNGIEAAIQVRRESAGEASEERLEAWKTKSISMSVELLQFWGVTSGTSSGSAKVMSTHYKLHACQRWLPSQRTFPEQQIFSFIHRIQGAKTYIIQRGSMLCRLNDLNGSIIADLGGEVGR